jgi:hypothetical protein
VTSRSFILLMPLVLFFGCSAVAGSVPTSLYNKTVLLRWTEHRSERSDTGEINNSTPRSDFSIYISSAGRLFSQFKRRNLQSGRSNSATQGPTGETTKTGMGASKQSMRFEDDQLISENAMKSGARRILVEFGNGYRDCQLTVIYGKEGNAPEYHRAMNGRMYTVLSADVVSPSCSVKDGNVFAGE